MQPEKKPQSSLIVRRFTVSPQRALVIMMLFFALAITLFSPTSVVPVAASFSINFTTIMDGASDFFNQIFPIFAQVLGIGVGVAILGLVISKILGAIKGASRG